MATEYGIRSIPTVMIFKNGQKMDAVIGGCYHSSLLMLPISSAKASPERPEDGRGHRCAFLVFALLCLLCM